MVAAHQGRPRRTFIIVLRLVFVLYTLFICMAGLLRREHAERAMALAAVPVQLGRHSAPVVGLYWERDVGSDRSACSLYDAGGGGENT